MSDLMEDLQVIERVTASEIRGIQADIIGEAEAELNARMYETITHAAREMTPLLTQKFMMRVKGSSDLGFSIDKKNDVKYLGKWVEVTVNWESKYFFSLKIKDSWRNLMFSGNEFEGHITQKGLAPKMYATWKLVNKK